MKSNDKNYMDTMLAAIHGLAPTGLSGQCETKGAFGSKKPEENPAGSKLAKRFDRGRQASPRGY